MKFLELSPIKVCFMVVDEERWKAKFSNNFNKLYFFPKQQPSKHSTSMPVSAVVPGKVQNIGQIHRPSPRPYCEEWTDEWASGHNWVCKYWDGKKCERCEVHMEVISVSGKTSHNRGQQGAIVNNWIFQMEFSKHLWNACYVPCSKDEK